VASGGIRAGIQKGPFTIGNAFEIMPFENELVVLAIKGSVLSEIVAEHNKSKKLNFSGILVSLKSANSTISSTST
jgi:2',3'-cyclic-nucleotide 2'-phosphodiesterase (5'-nucleotidase family)